MGQEAAATAERIAFIRQPGAAIEQEGAGPAAVLGGVGQLAGAFVGALGMGALSTAWEYETTASLGKVLTFACVILFLQWKPNGIISTRSRALD